MIQLKRNSKNIHGETDGIFIFRDDEISEIKKPQVEAIKPRAQSNLNISHQNDSVNKNNQQLLQDAEKKAIENVREQYINTDKWLKAPNGNDTNLTERQWLQVRTPQFKAWFGDWENDPENSSKVVDENGEPLVVYHGTSANFDVFDVTKTRANMDIQGNFFSPWELDAQGYGENILAVYLNIRNIATGKEGYAALKTYQGQNEAGIKARELLKKQGYDGVNNYDEEFITFYPNQIKSATDNSGEFNSENPSILFQSERKKIRQLKKQFRNFINDFNEDDFFLVGNNEYIQGENNPLKAAKFLLNKKQGVVKNAFKNTPYGDIGISYGDTEHGLYHIINKHILELDDFDSLTEVINTINDVLRNGTKKQIQGQDKFVVTKGKFLVSIAEEKTGDFVITGYDNSRSEKIKKRASNATLLDQSAFKKDGTLVLSEAYIKDNIKNIDLSSIRFQTAYHGSPHNFDRFTTDAIGTGEGSQSFGWGLYFTNQVVSPPEKVRSFY